MIIIRRASAGGGASTPLHELAEAAGAKHVWCGDSPLSDLVGGLNLSVAASGDSGINLPPGVGGAITRSVSAGSAGPSVAGVTIHKNADRSGLYMFRLDVSSPAHQGIMALGTFTDVNGGPCITALPPGSGSIVAFRDHNWSLAPKLDLYVYTTNLTKWCIVFWHWDKANARYNVAWRLEDGAEQTGTLSATVEGSGTCTVYAGAQGSAMNTVPAPFHRAAFALADGDALYDSAFRAACYASLGWT